VPHWNTRGAAQTGTYANGARYRCLEKSSRCVALDWPDGWFPYNPVRLIPEHWHGSLLSEKRDGSGLLYRRNRYYDPSSGRFTQEDPIGLAGGLNVYGFAAGDPVSYSDPYGLYIIVQGDRRYRTAVRNALQYMAANSESFARVYNALAASTEVTVMIANHGISNCRSWSGNCTRRDGETGAWIQFRPKTREYVQAQYGFTMGEGDWFLDDGLVLAHELYHAAGILAAKINTGVEPVCGATGNKKAEDCADKHEETVDRELKN
jgi:RHS repeat-associated protein